ncbi:hypothetical protein SeMB42_g04683 [Synchytrium endobioticum]|uniref:Uncharacterized protein n=1 Tax=Synchytrium endobioticum TaxID=286115 RepID=A0A507CWN0_9FUNG|nr:hypothetical protein SeMB42_g04683 [Synchytrium endobioticum]
MFKNTFLGFGDLCKPSATPTDLSQQSSAASVAQCNSASSGSNNTSKQLRTLKRVHWGNESTGSANDGGCTDSNDESTDDVVRAQQQQQGEEHEAAPARIRRYRENEVASRIHIQRNDTHYLLIFSMSEASLEAPAMPMVMSFKHKTVTHDMYINQATCRLCWVVTFPPVHVSGSGISGLSRKVAEGATEPGRPDTLPVEFSMNRFTHTIAGVAARDGNSYYFDLHADEDLLRLILETVEVDDAAKHMVHHSSDAVRWKGVLSIRVGGDKPAGAQWDVGVTMLSTVSALPHDAKTLGYLADKVSLNALALYGESTDMLAAGATASNPRRRSNDYYDIKKW